MNIKDQFDSIQWNVYLLDESSIEISLKIFFYLILRDNIFIRIYSFAQYQALSRWRYLSEQTKQHQNIKKIIETQY